MGMRAVIADDEVLIRMYIREILENNGYEVAGEAEDGMDAVTVCREQRPDFVIMDINMPVMTGLEAARVIREESLAGFVVVLTAYRDKEIAEQAVDLDVMGYVVKPVDEDTLIPAVRIAEKKYLELEEIVRTYTDLSESDIRLLLDVSHGLPFVGNLESGDTYINVLTRDGRSMVVAQYRHPDCDLYKRDIIGEMERREDEPAVYRALEHGTSGRGLIGIIDSGKTVVRHTVSPIFNEQRKVIGSLTYEYLNPDSDTEPIRLVSAEGEMPPFAKKMDKVISSLQDGFLIFDERGICTLSNGRTEELYREIGCTGGVTGKSYRELRLEGQPEWEEIAAGGTLRNEIQIGRYVFDETISAVQENGISQGIVIILRDKTRIRQLEDEIEYRAALVREVHHRADPQHERDLRPADPHGHRAGGRGADALPDHRRGSGGICLRGQPDRGGDPGRPADVSGAGGLHGGADRQRAGDQQHEIRVSWPGSRED